MSNFAESPPFELQHLLRPPERVTVTVPCRIHFDDQRHVKVEAAVVLSKIGGVEEAAVFVVIPPSSVTAVRLTHRMPISPTFNHSLNQTPPSPSVSYFHQSSRPHITLSLSSGDTRVNLRISSAKTALVHTLTTELRRLTDLSRQHPLPSSLAFSWLSFYPLEPRHEINDDDVLKSPGESSSGFITPTSISSLGVQGLNSPLTGLTITKSDASEDEEHPNPYSLGFARIAFIRKRLFSRQDRWSSRKPIRIRTTTFNVNDKLPPPGTTELASLVGIGEEDLLVFGFQEVDLRSSAMLISQGQSRAYEWETALMRSLGEKAADFEKIALTQYVGVMTTVFVKKSLKDAITRIETCERGIGLLGFGGNKAGVGVRLMIHNSTFCFVNSHLAAFASALDRRRSDFHTLLKGLSFPQPKLDDVIPAFEEFLPDNRDRFFVTEDSNVLIWMGDLNYRIDMEDDILRAWVAEKRYTSVLGKDQLCSDIASGKSFAKFSEGTIDFPPTYKYVLGSSTLDARRSPAYTDRILFANPFSLFPPHKVTCESYTPHEIMWSDHRPVSASLVCEVRVVNEEKRKTELGAIMKELDRLDEIYRPSLEVGSTHVDFGDVRYRAPVIREIMLRNTGRVSASFSFKASGLGRSICKQTIWPFPCSGVIEADQECALRVVAFVDEPRASRLTLGEEDMNDVLVLQVPGGKDTFISLQATFLPSIISLPLPLLTALPTPIREVTIAERKNLATKSNLTDEIPRGPKPVKEVWRLLEYLMAHGSSIIGLWLADVKMDEQLGIIECLDTNSSLPDDSVLAVSKALLHLLISLPTPLIPLSHHKACEAAGERDEAFAVLEGVPQVNTNVLIGLMSVVRLCLSETSAGLMDVLSTALFGMEVGVLGGTREGKRRFVKLLLDG